jgi:hypothetical protein
VSPPACRQAGSGADSSRAGEVQFRRRIERADGVILLNLEVYPSPLPCFLEVLILEGLQRDFSEVLILEGLKSFRMSTMQGVLEVLILKGLKNDFSEVLILEELRREKRENGWI